MDNHFIEKCRKCGRVIAQCRCPSKDKSVIFSICFECLKKGENEQVDPHDAERRR